MKNIRVELKLVAIVHVGADVTEDAAPARAPDATEEFTIARVSPLGPLVHARDAVPGQLVNLVGNMAPTMAERLRHELRQKGL